MKRLFKLIFFKSEYLEGYCLIFDKFYPAIYDSGKDVLIAKIGSHYKTVHISHKENFIIDKPYAH